MCCSAFSVTNAYAKRTEEFNKGVMAGLLIAHGAKSVRKTAKAFIDFLLGNHSFLDFLRKSSDSVYNAWHDYRAPSTGRQRKEAVDIVNEGVKLYNMKKHKEALQKFREATVSDPTYARAYLYLGNALYKLAEHSEAMRAWECAMSVEPNSSAAIKARDKVAKVQSQNQMAIRDLHDSLKKK